MQTTRIPITHAKVSTVNATATKMGKSMVGAASLNATSNSRTTTTTPTTTTTVSSTTTTTTPSVSTSLSGDVTLEEGGGNGIENSTHGVSDNDNVKRKNAYVKTHDDVVVVV